MANTFGTEDSFVNSIVGEGTRFRGDIELDGLLRVDGDFLGTIRSAGKVLVGKNGRAECTINACTVVIGGIVKGDIYSSEKVIVLSSGMVIGNIFCPRLIAEEGVLIDGNCTVNPQRSVSYEMHKKNGGTGTANSSRILSIEPHPGNVRDFERKVGS